MKFSVKTPYNASAVAAIKSIPAGDRRWNAVDKAWEFDGSRIFDVADLLEPFFPDLSKSLREDAKYAKIRESSNERSKKIEASRAKASNLEIPSPNGLSYLPYQRAGVEFCLNRQNILIGDQMGLGKTIQAIGTINMMAQVSGKCPRTLIICPASLKLNWERECIKWLTVQAKINVVNGHMDLEGDILIINYDILKKHIETIHTFGLDLLIADEVHYLKSPKAQRTKLVLGSKDINPIRAKKVIFLTGTPLPNRPIELWPIVHYLDPETFRSWKYFVQRYCDAYQDRYGWQLSGSSNLPELQEKLRSTVMIRRSKDEVLTELPDKVRQVIELPQNGFGQIVKAERDAWAKYESDVDTLRARVELAKAEGEDAYKDAVDALSAIEKIAFTEMSKIRHDTAVAKVPLVIEHVRDAIESSGKVVLFAHHRDVISSIAQEFGNSCVTLTGETSMVDRQAAVDRFQSDPTCTLFIGNLIAAGVGITLTAASHVVFAELDWVPGNVSQAEDRCHRIGQHNSVLVQHLVLDGTIDAEMAKRIVAKQSVIDAALDNKEVGTDLSDAKEWAKKAGEAASAHTPRKKIHEEGAKFTNDMILAVHEALQIVAGMCDGAAKRDSHGFNKIDAWIGRELAWLPELTKSQAALGRKIVSKYKRQFGQDLLNRMFPKREV